MTITIERPRATGAAPVFWLGTHKPIWLERTDVPLFIADQNLRDRRTLPKARGPWALDSGGFMQLRNTGRWQFTAREYVQRIARYQAEIGNLAWASPMDRMCEDVILAATGQNVATHQWKTLENYIELITIWEMEVGGRCPIIPVLQGWAGFEYLRHMDMYRAAGIDLDSFPVVGVGSVCRRQNTLSIGRIFLELHPLRMHGFGVKRQGLRGYGHLLASADSMAWSLDATHNPPMEGHTHQHCGNCLDYALRWRSEMLSNLGWETLAA